MIKNCLPTTKYDLQCTEADEKGIGKTYFPICVLYEGEKDTVIINSPDDLIDGKGFVVKKVRIGQ